MTWTLDDPNSLAVSITRRAWNRMTAELAHRGAGRKESGCFWLARPKDPKRRIRRIVYFDDLDAACLTGGIDMSSTGLAHLFELCARDELTALADVHTHPGAVVEQSGIDKANPMIGVAGHLALILPNYAAGDPGPEMAGIHLHLGGRQWQKLDTHDRRRFLRVVTTTWRTK